jgi:energy-coupling factor transporter ATP-binding protein EcfA2
MNGIIKGPVTVHISGPQGSGKTTIARLLEAAINAHCDASVLMINLSNGGTAGSAADVTIIDAMNADNPRPRADRHHGRVVELGSGYGTLDEAGQRAYHGLPPEEHTDADERAENDGRVWRSPDGQSALRHVDPGPYGTTPGVQPVGRKTVRTTVLDAEPLERLASMDGPWDAAKIAAMGDAERGAAVHAKLEQIIASMSVEDQNAFLFGEFDNLELSPEQEKWITEMNDIMDAMPWREAKH